MEKQAEPPVVEESSTTPPNSPRSLAKRQMLFIVLAIALMLCAAGLVTATYLAKKQKPQTTPKKVDSSMLVCKDDLYKRASVAINANNLRNLKAVTDEIKNKPNYDKDGTCLYILTTYYVMNDDLANAKKFLAQYTTYVQQEQKGNLASNFNEQKLKSLTAAVAALQKQDEAAAKNQVYGPTYKNPDGAENPNLKKANQ